MVKEMVMKEKIHRIFDSGCGLTLGREGLTDEIL